jgi:PIN domain nuclease of toxin-antitoxin system
MVLYITMNGKFRYLGTLKCVRPEVYPPSAAPEATRVSKGERDFLRMSEPFEWFIPHQIQINGFDLLPILFEHLSRLTSLPFHHRDPFDRLLIAQCLTEKCTIISRDAAFDSYQIERLW